MRPYDGIQLWKKNKIKIFNVKKYSKFNISRTLGLKMMKLLAKNSTLQGPSSNSTKSALQFP
jgi:hypothetical protein